MTKIAAVILAAGQGTRMRSQTPKVLHPVLGRPMVLWTVKNAKSLGADDVVLVVGNGADAVRETVGDGVTYVQQKERLGTGHATLQAKGALVDKADVVLVLYGDMPVLQAQTLKAVIDLHTASKPALTMLTVRADDPMGFGRVVRDGGGQVRAIVEEAVATPEILAIDELNCGVYCFDADWLWEHLRDVPVTQPKGEYYLTDMVAMAVADGRHIEVVTIEDVSQVQGINTRVHLARAERNLRERINEQLMLSGVTMIDPATTYIEPGVIIGQDTVIQPNTHLKGATVIGQRCEVGPNTVIRDTTIGDDCVILASVLEEAIVEDHVDMGPFGHLRPKAHLASHVHMGNFGEVKNSYLAPGVKMGHFSYVGDAQVGENANISAGIITCNYDGANKHKTQIGKDAFIGSGTMLVAPVNIGDNARVGAGSVVTRDIGDGELAYGVPARRKERNKVEDHDAE